MNDFTFFIEIIKSIGFPALIFIVWFIYHKSQVEFFKQILKEQAEREERNFQSIKDLTEALQVNIASLCRIEYKIDTGMQCPFKKEMIK
jgi:hypothetical protein